MANRPIIWKSLTGLPHIKTVMGICGLRITLGRMLLKWGRRRLGTCSPAPKICLLKPWTEKAPATRGYVRGRGKLSRAERHQSSALSALLHHAGPNASEVAVVTVRGLVRLCQRVVRRCHRSLQIGKGDTYPTSNSWRGPVRSLSTSFAEGEFHRRPRSSQQVEGSEADDWAKAIAGGSEEVVG